MIEDVKVENVNHVALAHWTQCARLYFIKPSFYLRS